MNLLGFNEAQIFYTFIIVGLFSFIYGRRFYKQHNKKQQERESRRKKWTK